MSTHVILRNRILPASPLTSLDDLVDRIRVRLVVSGVIWPSMTVIVLVAAVLFPWVSIPLIHTLKIFAVPIDIGWGLRIKAFSYGTLALLVALGGAIRLALALDMRQFRFLPRPLRQFRPLNSRALLLYGLTAASIPLIYIYQFLLVDFRYVAATANQETQSLLITSHLSYALPAQNFAMDPFAVATSSPQDRLMLLIQVIGPGFILIALASIFSFFGAYAMFVRERARREKEPAAPKLSRKARIIWLAIATGLLILFLRAPLGLSIEALGRNAAARGDYNQALQFYDQAGWLSPSLQWSPDYHRERGLALYRLHRRTSLDVGLYLAAQYRMLGAVDRAWNEDDTWYQRFPNDELLRQDMLITLALKAESSSGGLPPGDSRRLKEDPLVSQHDAYQVLPSSTQALPWLEKILALQPDNEYALFFHGRIYFSLHMYDVAAQDFTKVITATNDHDMQSAAYTYLAFCQEGKGDYAGLRILLRKAVQLDRGYYNTLAREAASGLH